MYWGTEVLSSLQCPSPVQVLTSYIFIILKLVSTGLSNTDQGLLDIKQFVQGPARRLLTTWDGIPDSYGLQVLCRGLL